MTALVFELFEALKRAGVDEETARRAAQAVLSIDDKSQLATKADLIELRIAIETRLARLETDITWIKWIITGGVGLYVLRSIMEWFR